MLADQLEGLRKATSMEKQIAQRQMDEAMQRLEETISGLREELHERECQVAELHMAHQVRGGRATAPNTGRHVGPSLLRLCCLSEHQSVCQIG